MSDVNYWMQLNKINETGGITPPLSHQINLLGTLLGEAVTANASSQMLDLVERLRIRCKQAEQKNDFHVLQLMAQELAQLSLENINWLLRVYVLFFNLVNEAEIQEIIRINQDRTVTATIDEPAKESILAAIKLLKEQNYSYEQAVNLIKTLDIQFTLTAHPTEARRQTVLQKQRDIGNLLHQLNQPLSLQQQSAIIEQLQQYIAILLYTDNVRSNNLTVANEVRNGLFYLRTTIWQVIPEIYQDLEFAFQQYYKKPLPDLQNLISYRSWIGGDCDGNPFVTPLVMRETLQQHLKAALKTYLPALKALHNELSISERKIKVDPALIRSLKQEEKQIILDLDEKKHLSHEPYRLKINYILAKLEAKICLLKGSATPKQIKIAKKYQIENFEQDLFLIRNSLIKSKLSLLAKNKLLTDLLLQVKTFGFHMAALDIRQHSAVHAAAIDEILAKLKIVDNYKEQNEEEKINFLTDFLRSAKKIDIKKINLSKMTKQVLATFGVMYEAPSRSRGSYIISMTHHLSDILAVLALAKLTGLWHYKNNKVSSLIDVVPLFETIEDLSRIESLLTTMYSNKIYKQHLQSRHNLQEVMLGYSDSNKDGGYFMANYLLHKAQASIGLISRRYKIDFKIFHGRGGSAGRGGGRVHHAIMVMSKESQNGRMRVTEQGEVISFHYGLEAMAHRHYEQTIYAMILANTKPCKANHGLYVEITKQQDDLLQKIADYSFKNYRHLIQDPNFWQWYIHITPIEFISKLPIASRPVSRKAAKEVDFNSLRAIPWVFSWTQTRYNVPGWFGVGHALSACIAEDPKILTELQILYQNSPFFNWLIDNVQQEMAKTHLKIAQFYQQFYSQTEIDNIISADFQLAEKNILLITAEANLLDNNQVLQKSISLRNPYTDVLNLLQIELMRRFYQQKDKTNLQLPLLLSVNDLACAMQSTG